MSPTHEALKTALEAAPSCATADDLIQVLERIELGWSLDSNGRLIEARIWQWPSVVGRYRPDVVEPLRTMHIKALENG
jgi:hypothetical protein